MNQESREGALSRVEAAELPELTDLILFPGIDAAVPVDHQTLGIHNVVPDAEAEAHEARAVVQPGLPNVIKPLDAAALESELGAHQVVLVVQFGQYLEDHQENAEGFYFYLEQDSEDEQDAQPGDINKHHELVKSSEPAAENLHQNSEPAGDVNNIMDQIRDSPARDINMMDQNPDSSAGDINAVHVDDSVPAEDINIDRYSEPRDNMMDLDSDTNVENLSESQSTVLRELQTHNPLVAEIASQRPVESIEQVGTSTPSLLNVSHEPATEEGFVESPSDGSLIQFNRLSTPISSLTVVPSPLPSSRLQPSSSPLTISESSLDPNLITSIR